MKYLKRTLFIALTAYVLVLVTNTEVLLNESQVRQEGYGQDSLICTYFNGRKTLTREYWYAPNDFMGRASCDFLL